VTRRDVVIALLTAGAVYAATMYGGPLAGRAAKVVVPVVVERVADRIEQVVLSQEGQWLPSDARRFDKLSGTNAEPASDQDSELLAELFRQMRHSKAVQPLTVVVE